MEIAPYDKDKAEHFFAHCLSASVRLSHREMSRRELVGKLKKLAQFSVDRSFRTHLVELEDHINDLVKKERRILSVAKKEREVERGLQEKIDALEEKLNRYVEQKAVHEIKIRELETRVKSRMKRRAQIHELKNQIHALQEVYDEVVGARYLYDPSKIRKVEHRLTSLKAQLAGMEGGATN